MVRLRTFRCLDSVMGQHPQSLSSSNSLTIPCVIPFISQHMTNARIVDIRPGHFLCLGSSRPANSMSTATGRRVITISRFGLTGSKLSSTSAHPMALLSSRDGFPERLMHWTYLFVVSALSLSGCGCAVKSSVTEDIPPLPVLYTQILTLPSDWEPGVLIKKLDPVAPKQFIHVRWVPPKKTMAGGRTSLSRSSVSVPARKMFI
jgi:hypothetical protein